jgi:hypothetical protein
MIQKKEEQKKNEKKEDLVGAVQIVVNEVRQ